MYFVTILNNVITGIHCSDVVGFNNPNSQYFGQQCIILPDGVMIDYGRSIDEYDEDWKLKPFSQRIEEGILNLPDTWVLDLDSETIRPLTETELMIKGILELPKGFKLENNSLIEKSIDEKYIDNDITKEEYENYYKAIVEEEKQRLLSIAMSNEFQARAMIDSDFKERLNTFIKAILDIEKQKGYPFVVTWGGE